MNGSNNDKCTKWVKVDLNTGLLTCFVQICHKGKSSTLLEDLMEVIRQERNLSRKFLHLLLREQLLKLDLSFGVGEVFYGLKFLPRCKRLRDLSLAYLRHIEPYHIMPIIPYLKAMVSLNLTMSSATDALIKKIAENCPCLMELDVTSTYVSDDGLRSLCGMDCSGKTDFGCFKIQRLMISDTRTSWVGAYEALRSLPILKDFDFDKIFQVFEHLDPTSLKISDEHPELKLRALYSTTPSIRAESIDAAAKLCPKAEILSVMNTWIDNDTFYKFMQFEHLKTLTIFNSEGKTIDYGEGILPVLQVVGPKLENLILSKFTDVDLISLGRSCPKLRKIALSAISELQTSEYGPEEHLFSNLTNLELWIDNPNDSSSYDGLLQLLYNCKHIDNILIKKSNAFGLELLMKIWLRNPMRRLSRLMLDQCHGVGREAMIEWLRMENDLTTIRIWNCNKFKQDDKCYIQDFINQWNLDVYLEWFE